MANWAKQSIRLLKHELKRGELTIIVLAIVLGVASVFSLAGFSGKIKQALLNESTSFIAADRVLQTSRKIDFQNITTEPIALSRDQITQKSQQLNIKQAQQVLMSSMVFAGDVMGLVEIQAVSNYYPLRGELLVNYSTNTNELAAVNAPDLGTVFIEEKILSLLEVTIGDVIDIGDSRFVIKAIAKQIPDASFSVFTSGAKVIINIADLEKTQLVQPGSRLTYKYLFSGDVDAIKALSVWLKPKLNDSQRWYDIQSKQSPLANALNKAEKYLSLASLLGIILAAVAVSVASRRYAQRHQSSVGVYKAMGASFSHIRKLYYLHWSLLSVVSIALGLLVGYVLAQLGLYAIQDYLPVQLTLDSVSETGFSGLISLGFYPLIIAVFTGLLCAFAFAITPLKELIATSPLVVIRGASLTPSHQMFRMRVGKFLIPLLALLLLLFVFSNDLMLSVSLLIGGILVSALLLLFGRLLMKLTRNIGTKAGASWHLALANLQRRAQANSVQLVSFTIAIKLLLMIIVIRSALLSEWQAQLPEQTPNLFLVNIAQNQVDNVEQFIDQQGITASDIYAVIRGRLSAINSDKIAKQVSKEQTDGSDNGRQGVGRELNLTWREHLPKENSVVQGKWWQNDLTDANKPQVSIEQTLAKRLDIKLGDSLTFQLGSEVITVPVTSIREVNWQSMQPNFYMIFNPQVLADYPASYISSLYVSVDKKDQLQKFLSAYPTISVIDVDAMIAQLRKVIDQVSKAVEFILVLVVFAGCLVLVAQVQASMEEREREIAILRTIGAKGSLLRNSILLEFVALGAIAGFMASVAMELTVYLLQSHLFKMQTSFHFEYWLLGIVAGASFVGIVGLLSCWRLLNMSSVTLIRRTM
ncbi:ABC transporter permease [Candidatus Colwellia aromaticivorans]|uniref:ABC transporter permease n=1 Tax=Candidatus Colwellia aromaticivorans TaxID=2267621 RepID=UPI000DF37BA2|nr:FtsX-like permease family protein [Candidatus Colwellia aromaticivorans]